MRTRGSPGCSTLTTSTPRSASQRPASGPAQARPNSTIRTVDEVDAREGCPGRRGDELGADVVRVGPERRRRGERADVPEPERRTRHPGARRDVVAPTTRSPAPAGGRTPAPRRSRAPDSPAPGWPAAPRPPAPRCGWRGTGPRRRRSRRPARSARRARTAPSSASSSTVSVVMQKFSHWSRLGAPMQIQPPSAQRYSAIGWCASPNRAPHRPLTAPVWVYIVNDHWCPDATASIAPTSTSCPSPVRAACDQRSLGGDGGGRAGEVRGPGTAALQRLAVGFPREVEVPTARPVDERAVAPRRVRAR